MTERKMNEQKMNEQKRTVRRRSACARSVATGLAIATALFLVVGALIVANTDASTSVIASTAISMDADRTLGGGARQTLIVSPSAPATSVYRDGYGVTSAPPLVWPLEGKMAASDQWGIRDPPCGGCSAWHEGVDFPAKVGTAVRAVADGHIQVADSNGSTPLGVFVTVDHLIEGQAVSSTYGHLLSGSLELGVGDRVTVGQVIGRVGSTGMSTGPHLHFEIRTPTSGAVDPIDWMTLMLD